MIIFLRKCIFASIFLSPFVFAQSLSERFSGQKTLSSSQLVNQNYALALGRLEKIDGEWLAEEEKLIQADVEKLTYEISRPFNFDSAWETSQAYFSEQNAELIFQCSGLACGSSNAWANEYFAVKQLYGIDLSQRYQVWLLDRGASKEIAVLYLVKRGNRRVYLHLETLSVKNPELRLSPSTEVIALNFYKTGKVNLQGIKVQDSTLTFDSAYLEKYSSAFNQKSYRKLTVKVVDALPGSEQERQARALDYGNQISEFLQGKGVRKHRISVEGLAGDAATSPKLDFSVELRNLKP